ncbi:MAG: hypothetical protein CXZ00_08225 [Acidobacteria bacterium]|nr:MAG: hypothetical protein CXZ00_08225 [Acidobacteriota bacterium]
MGEISDRHPLRLLLSEQIARHFDLEVGLRDEEIWDYLTNLLTEFCDAHKLYGLKNAEGRSLDDVGEMLLESDPIYGPAASFDREREVRKHIGDFTLFFSGMFPESVNRFRLRRQRLENLIDFVHAGKESYFIVSQFDQMEYRKVAPLFGRLSRNFETCVFGLNLVHKELIQMQYSLYRPEDLLM